MRFIVLGMKMILSFRTNEVQWRISKIMVVLWDSLSADRQAHFVRNDRC